MCIVWNMIAPNETRETLPDQLRGVALLGIVFVNMPFLALGNGGLAEQPIATASDGVIAFLIVALAQGKFYLLFSFLFGYSFTLALRRRTVDGLRNYRRRLIGLAVLGILHAVFLFIGDILISYSLLGIALLWFTARSTRTALVGAGVAYAASLILLAAIVLTVPAADPAGGGFVASPAALDSALKGSFLDAAIGRITALPDALAFQALINWLPALAMFLLGLAAGRAGLLANPERYRRLWMTLVIVALAVGLPAGILSAWLQLGVIDPSGGAAVLGLAIGFGAAPALTCGYVALVALATRTRVMALTAPAGRMSLTGYLGESIILSAIFCGWGLGLYGRLGITASAAITLGVWLALELFASVWLRRFDYGPFEWMLRSWSRGQLVPLRRRATS